jgi:hypothetical protein
MIHMDLGGHPFFPLNHHFEHVVLINHNIHPFDGEWNVMSYPFVNYRHHVIISSLSYVHVYNIALMHRIPLELPS